MLTQREILQLPMFVHKNQIDEFCSPLFKTTGLSFFEYVRLDAESSSGSFITNNREGKEVSLQRALYQTSCFALHPSQYQSGCYLWSEFPDNEETITHLSQFGWENGISLVYPAHDAVHMFGFAGDTQALDIGALLRNNRDVLTVFAGAFLANNTQLIQASWDKRLALRLPNATTPWIQHKNQPIEELQASYLKHYQEIAVDRMIRQNDVIDIMSCELRSLHHSHDKALEHFNCLSQREQTCLRYLVRGLSTVEIAQRLDVTTRSVGLYIDRIKKQFGCLRRSELVTQYACFA